MWIKFLKNYFSQFTLHPINVISYMCVLNKLHRARDITVKTKYHWEIKKTKAKLSLVFVSSKIL